MEGNQEFYHNFERYENEGLKSFILHASEYISGKRTVPVSKPNVLPGMKEITFTLSDILLKQIVKQTPNLKKPYQVAMKYGLRGHTNGGINGIFFQDKESTLGPQTSKLISSNEKRIQEDLDVPLEDLDSLRHIKVVWHEPSGKRIVGVYNMSNERVFLLDFANY